MQVTEFRRPPGPLPGVPAVPVPTWKPGRPEEDLLRPAAWAGRWPGRLAGWVGTTVAPVTRETRQAVAVAAALRRPVTTGRRIAVVSVRGGAGKSTVALLLASAFAYHRPDRVLAVDADPGFGSLALRAGLPSAGAPRSVESSTGTVPAAGGAPGPVRSSGGLWVLPGGRGSAHRRRAARGPTLAELARSFTITVIDGTSDSLLAASVADVHALVVVAPATVDGVLTTSAALGDLRDGPRSGQLARTVLVFSAASPQAGTLRLGPAAHCVAVPGLPVLTLPHDRHLATGGRVDPGRLGAATRLAVLRLGAVVLRLATLHGQETVMSPPVEAR